MILVSSGQKLGKTTIEFFPFRKKRKRIGFLISGKISGRKILNVLNQNNKKLIISINCDRKELDVRIPYRKWRGWRPAEKEFEKNLIMDFCQEF